MHSIQSYTLPPDKLALAVQYAFARHVLYFSEIALSAIVLLALIHWRVAPRLRSRPMPLVIAIIFAITAVFELPIDISYHALSLHYGISIQQWPGWFADWLKAQALSLFIAVIAVWGFYFLLHLSPRRWWLYAWLACLPLILVGTWIEPYVVEPLFNNFEPLAKQHPELVAPIEKLLHKAGVTIPQEKLFEMKASSKTNSLNAYVSGFGSSKRVVLYDTIIRKEPEPELMTTFGHELGHYVLGHIVKGIVYASVLLLLGFYCTYVLIKVFVSRWGKRFDVRSPADRASLPVFALILLLLNFIGDPIGNAYSRRQEAQADAYSLYITTDIIPDPGQASARAFQIEGETDLEPPHPNPFIVFWLYSHPPISDRVSLAVRYYPIPSRTP